MTGRVVDSYTNIHSVKMFAHHDRELDYAKEAIENTPPNLPDRDAHLHDRWIVTLVTLNGLLIVGVVGWAVYLWMQGQARSGRWRRQPR